MTTAICCICRRRRRVAWYLTGYHGIGTQFNGRGTATVAEPCCRQCFASIAHDGFGKPRHPALYARALAKYRERQEKPCKAGAGGNLSTPRKQNCLRLNQKELNVWAWPDTRSFSVRS